MTLKYYIFENPNDNRKEELKNEIRTKLQNIVTDPAQADLILVLWGDGTMLDAIHKLYKYNKPFFGINFWTLGFLANEVNTVHEIPQEINGLEVITEPLLEANIYCENWKILTKEYAVNEFTLGSAVAWTKPRNHFTIKVWNASYTPIIWDKLIIAWSIGSTWTRLNYNGKMPLIEHWIWSLWIQGVWTSPFIYQCFEDEDFEWDKQIIVDIHSRYKTLIEIDCSHKTIENINKVVITYSQQLYQLCFLKNWNKEVFATKRRKLYAKKTNGTSSLIPVKENNEH
jgi:NAD+ kinase